MVSQIKYKPLGLFPAEAGVGYRLAVYILAYFLVSVFDIALYHQTLYKLSDVLAVAHTVKYLFRDAYLLEVLLSGIRVIRIHDERRILEPFLSVGLSETIEVFVVVIREGRSRAG